jgi:hypothetical protein
MKYATVRLIHIVGFLFAAALFAATAQAQGAIDDAVSHVGIGVGVTHYDPTSDDGQTSQGLAVAYRWHNFHSGWGPSVGLDWHSTNFDQTLGGVDATLGSFQMRALLAGFGHTRHLGRFFASANMSAGYAFNNFTVAKDVAQTFAGTGVGLQGVHVDNSWVLKPSVAAWYDVLKHVGVGVGAAYLVARPSESITTVSGIQKQHLKTDAFELTAGVTFGLWKEKP